MWGYGDRWGMMGGWGWGGHWGGAFGGILWMVLVVLLIVGVVRLIGGPRHRPDRLDDRPRRSAAIDALETRYARGEINRDEFLERRRDLLGEPSP